MKRLLIAAVGLLLAACAPPTYTDLIEAAHGPVVADPAAAEENYYLMPGSLPADPIFTVPDGTEVIGTWSFGEGATRAYLRTTLSPEDVVAFYKQVYDHALLLDDYRTFANFCTADKVISIITQRGAFQIQTFGHNDRCTALSQSPPSDPAPFRHLMPDVEAGGAVAHQSPTSTRLTALIPHGGQTTGQIVSIYRQQIESEGWESVDTTLSDRSAWVVWQQDDEDLGRVQLDMALTLQTEEQAILALVVTFAP